MLGSDVDHRFDKRDNEEADGDTFVSSLKDGISPVTGLTESLSIH